MNNLGPSDPSEDDSSTIELGQSNQFYYDEEDSQLSPGDLIGDYEVISLVGVGGMGQVYEARHTILNKVYAVKTIRADQLTEKIWRRMQIEAQAIARMNHPNIVGIHNFGIADGRPFYVMDLLKGVSLAQKLASRGALPIKEALAIFIEVALGLNYAHKKGIIHRDIKPGNIILLKSADSSGAKVKIVDFGIAKLAGAADPNNQNLTSMGEIFGSPLYMSPEQCLAERSDARSDVYALGCTLFETLTGEPPFRGNNAMQTMMLHQGEPAPSLAEKAGKTKKFPEALELVLAKMLAKKPRDRYQSLAAVAEDLEEINTARPSTKETGSSGQLKNIAVIVVAISACTLIVAGLAIVAIGGTSNLPALTKLFVAKEDLSTSKVESKLNVDETMLAKTTKPESSLLTNHVCSFERRGKKLFRVFHFPQIVFGAIHSVSGLGGEWKASGRLEFPAETQLVFASYSTMMTHPENFEFIRDGDFDGIGLRYIADGDAPDSDAIIVSPKPIMSDITACLKHMSHLKKLKTLSLSNCNQLKDSDISLINLFPQLTSLDLNATNADGAEVAKLVCIKNLKYLDASNCRNITPILRAVRGNKNMIFLKINSVKHGVLSKEDINNIASLTNLEVLELGGPGVTGETVETLSGLSKIKHFTASKCTIDRRAVKSFKKMKQLETITIENRNWPL